MSQRKKRTSYGELRLIPVLESKVLDLVVRHGLVEVPRPTQDPARPRAHQTAARWLDLLAEDHEVRLMLDKAGERWLLTRDPAGLVAYAKIGGLLRHMERESLSVTPTGGATPATRREALSEWLSVLLEARASGPAARQ